jgi:membrane fusion protein (multidrug efflux system)
MPDSGIPRLTKGLTEALAPDPAPRRGVFVRVLRPILIALGAVAIAAAAAIFWFGSPGAFSTDDSYVRAAKLTVSTDISGIVAQVAVHEGQSVHQGQLLFQLDPEPFEHDVAAAQAALDATALSLQSEKFAYQRLVRDIAAYQAQTQSDAADQTRFQHLIKTGAVSRAEFDQANYRMTADHEKLASLQMQARVELAKLAGDANIDVHRTPAYRQAEAKLAEARRQLSHTRVLAPFDGTVMNADTLQPGQYLAAATAALGLVSATDVWVQAYPKETQLTWARPGNPATITVDAYPGITWAGTLDEISPASDASFAVLPAQNASGNWVKVVQRIAIRVHITPKPGAPPLRDGMSVNVTIQTGHVWQWHDLF